MTRPAVVLADVNVDLTLDLPDRSIPKAERKLSEPRISGGGTGGNTAAALAALGTPVEFHGTIGDDAFGRWVTEDFWQAGVGLHGLVILHDAPTAQVIALLEPDGERYLVIYPPTGGAHTHMQAAHLNHDLLTNASWVHTTGMCLRASPLKETILAGLAMAREAGVPTSIDLNLRIELWGLSDEVRATVEAAVALSDVVFGNGVEEVIPLAKTDSIEAAVRMLSGGQRATVARIGAGGAIACAPDGTLIHAPGFPAAVVNTIGAGDAFNGGFITAMTEGAALAEALRWGNAVGALKVARSGGPRDLPGRAEVEALLKG